jgi:hypothetical protein
MKNSAGKHAFLRERVFIKCGIGWKLIPFNKKSMSEKDNAVTGGTAAPTGGVKDEKGSQGAPTGEKDAEQLLAEANARIAKLAGERDNYKRGMLKAKGKIVDSDDDEDEDEKLDMREIARQAALEALAETDFVKATSERDQLIAQMAKENKELRLAMSNKPGTGTMSGSNQETQKVKDHILSEEQERELRSRGFDDAKIEYFKKLASR